MIISEERQQWNLSDYTMDSPNIKSKVGLVIPCFNEADRLDFNKFVQVLEKSEWLFLLFVDDGSTDNTKAVLDDFCAQQNNLRCSYLSLEKNMGKGEAVRYGMKYLLETENYYSIGFWDADLATPLNLVVKLVSLLESQPNLMGIIGSRVKLCGLDIQRTVCRHYIGRILATFITIFLDIEDIYDTQCGSKLFRSNVLKEALDERFATKWLFDIELLLRIKKQLNVPFNLWLIEYPLEKWHDIPGSKITWRSFGTILNDIFIIYKYG